MLAQIRHTEKILRQLGKSPWGKTAVFDDGDERKIIGLSSSKLLIVTGTENKGYESYPLHRVRYIIA